MNYWNKLLLVVVFCVPFRVWSQYFPEKAFPVLFRDVQLAGIFPDSKTFADAVPLHPEPTIRRLYQKQKRRKNFELKKFVLKYFSIPSQRVADITFKKTSVPQHIEAVWDHLERAPLVKDSGSLLALPYPYVVPGGRFNEIYYWDSYFTMLGLKVSGRNSMIRNMVDNFAYQVNRFGFVPNGSRSYYLTRSQPPFFSLMVELLASLDSNKAYIDYLPQLLKEYEFWMSGTEKLTPADNSYRRVVRVDDQVILNRYWDDANTPRPESFREDRMLGKQRNNAEFYRHIRAACESGWDFSSRWLKDSSLSSIHTTDIIPVDLNCLLYHLEYTIMRSYLYSGNRIQAQVYMHKAQSRKAAIVKYFWNDSLDFFTDFDFKANTSTRSLTVAGIYPLFLNLAPSDLAYRTANTLEKQFLFEGGLIATTVKSPQQWDAPNGWAPLQYIGYTAMKNYKWQTLADSIAVRWMRTIEHHYEYTHKLLEKYNVMDPSFPGGGGEYPNQDGFGWTNGVYLHLRKEVAGH